MQQSPCKAKVVCIPCAIIPFSLLPETFSFASPPPLSDNLSVSLASAFLSLFLSRLSVQMSALSYLFARAQSNILLPLFTSTALPHRHSFFRHCPSPSLNFFFIFYIFPFFLPQLNLLLPALRSHHTFPSSLYSFVAFSSFEFLPFAISIPFFAPFLLHPCPYPIPPPPPPLPTRSCSWIMALTLE